MPEASDFETVSTRQQRIAELAKQSPQMAFTSTRWITAICGRFFSNGFATG